MVHLGRAAPTLGKTATSKVTRMLSSILGSLQLGARPPSPQAPPAEGQRSRCVAWWVALAAQAPRPRRLREGRPASRRARSFEGAGAAWEAGCGLKGLLAWVTAPQLALGWGGSARRSMSKSGRAGDRRRASPHVQMPPGGPQGGAESCEGPGRRRGP